VGGSGGTGGRRRWHVGGASAIFSNGDTVRSMGREKETKVALHFFNSSVVHVD
jgi:hypothetical protein